MKNVSTFLDAGLCRNYGQDAEKKFEVLLLAMIMTHGVKKATLYYQIGDKDTPVFPK